MIDFNHPKPLSTVLEERTYHMNPKLFRGLTIVSAFLLAGSITASSMLEKYSTQMDQVFGTVSSKTEYEKLDSSDQSDPWNYKSQFKTAKEAVEGYKEFSIREAQETFALLKNENNALPLKKKAKVTLMGVRSYAPVYGNSSGSIADKNTIDNGNKIYESLANYFDLNPSMLATYEKYFKDKQWGSNGYGAKAPEYPDITTDDEVPELSPSELAGIDANYKKDYSSYGDAAIVVVGRPGGETKEYELGGHDECTTGNIMSLSDEERAVIKEAKENFKNVIVLINSVTQMEIAELKDDKDISAIMWIGYPGAYGFTALGDVLDGTVSPSASLGDIYVTNNQANPAMQSYGNIPWANAESFNAAENVNSYLVEAEGIYQGYRYYETRYNDIINGVHNADTAKAGTWTKSDDYKVGTTDGTWKYASEVTYPFGYGLSYTKFEETLDSVSIDGDKKTATVTVTVRNIGDVAGKKSVQLYAQSPYTDYDKKNGVEKSAIQLMDFEKTKTLKSGESETITMHVDMQNIASYDYINAKTWILDNGTYTFALGDDSHDALNNILASQGKTTQDGMDKNGNKNLTYSWEWTDFDTSTFRYSETGKEITNQLSEGDYSMDLNSFMPNTVTYFTRSDWNGTFPKSYAGLSAEGRLSTLLKNDFIELKTNEDTSDVKFGDTTSTLTLADLKGVTDFTDPRYDELANKVTVDEFLSFASNAFHNIQKIESVGYSGNKADDGPGGSDTHAFNEGTYQGVAYTDTDEALVKGSTESYLGTRVAPSPQNLAYSFNKELAYENGEIIIGETSLVLNLPIMIGPGGNLHRHGYNGRGGEYYSEDPVLSGYVGSAVVQGAQSKGCLVNIKHAAFNDQETNRSGIAVFMNEQKARELELRNLNCMFTGKGKPSSFYDDESKKDSYKLSALGVMTSYNRIGAVASSANYAVQQTIMRDEWGFTGYSVTDFTGVSLKAAPKESILAGTVAFCGFGKPNLDYWNAEALTKDKNMANAIHTDIKYILYSLANSNALNGVNANFKAYTVKLNTWWRSAYTAAIITTAILTGGFAVLTGVFTFLKKKEI